MFYLYFILPPVIIVVSLALVIFLISRRSLEISREIETGEAAEIESRISMEVKSKWLHFLEKIAHSFKILALKIHNWTERRLAFIKSKKNKIESDLDKKDFEENGWGGLVEHKDEVLSQKIEMETPREVANSMDLIKNYKTDKIKGIFRRSPKQEKEIHDVTEIQEERIMISKEVVYPEERKEELESILVERIASDPRDIEAYERLGDYYVSQGNKVDAESCYKQVLKLNPQSLSVRNKLSRFKRRRF
ncbi:MAG: tetratricopeptide repeat protein [Candidatus Moraniibacteriota bacterium]